MRNLIAAWVVSSALLAPAAGAAEPTAQPMAHMLAPGFTARALPVKLTNVNALAFAPDGRLFAAGYDGRIRRLVDTDGDGLEDRAEMFWDKDTLISPIAAVWAPEGLYVSSHLKVSLLRDADGDGKADREEVVATGWPKIPSGSGLVDAMGIALDRDGSLFVGIGCADFANPYLLKDDRPHYDPKGELGAILKVAPDRKSRSVFAGGLRFTYALKFNRHGDLFATDQEGETWLKGANPLDELDHILPGRHYGWPPRHETYLPKVVDEPPVVGFGPQHQSACGMAFDESRPGWKLFGPAAWDGDALVAGFSRGKVWRVRLARTPAGYVGRPVVLLNANRMIADVAISPSGALYLTGHSGEPDWGTGPKGEGTIYKVTYDDPGVPQPIAAWPAGPLDVHVAFDRPLDPGVPAALNGTTIAYGAHVRAGDRFEAMKPPYKAVQEQQAAPRGVLRVASARLEDGGRTLVLATDPHPREAHYALTVPMGRGATTDLDYSLSGVDAAWDDGTEGAKPAWSGWWPHLDTDVVRPWTAGSSAHERGLALLARPGRLVLRTLVTLPEGRATLRLRSNGPIAEATLAGEAATPEDVEGGQQVDLTAESTGDAVDLSVTLRTRADAPLALHASFRTEADPTERPLPLSRLAVPWAPAAPPTPPATAAVPAILAGGDAKRGEAVFYSEAAKCSSCHKVRGKGGDVGPDLSNLGHRDAASVYRDIAEPSATINPDYVPYTVALKNGQVAVGVVRAEGADRVRVLDTNAKATLIPRADVEELRPSATSIMPVGLVGALGEAKMRDLVAFLVMSRESSDR